METSAPARWTAGAHDLVGDCVREFAVSHPDRVAVSRRVEGQWLPVTSEALAADVEALAAGIVAAGVEVGDRVGLMSRTRYEWLLWDLAILSAGAVTVPVYETSSAEQVEWVLSDSGAVAVVVESDAQSATVDGLRPRLPDLRQVWRLEADRFRLTEDGFGTAPELLEQRRAGLGPHSTATLVYTSGTTGRPKGCVLTHGNLLALVHNVLAADGVTEEVFNPDQSTLLFLPLAHVLARVIQLSALQAGVRLGHTDMTDVAADLKAFRPTVVLSVPRVFEKVWNSARHTAQAGGHGRLFDRAEAAAVAWSESLDAGGPDLRLRLRHAAYQRLVYSKVTAGLGGQVRWAVSGGAPLGAHLGHVFRGLGLTVLEGYGLTETSAGATLNLPGRQRVGSVGPPVPGSAVRIADDGEILLRGAHVFAGYWRNEAATAEVLGDDGWLRTGDVGRLDEDGFVYITDRKKDLIVTSAGKNVAPAVLEDRLRAHWLVSQALVVGDAKPYVGALLTLDDEAFTTWKAETGKPLSAGPDAMGTDRDLLEVLQGAVDGANSAVSQAEAIKRWSVLPHDFELAAGEVTPTLKVRRSLVTTRYADAVAHLYD